MVLTRVASGVIGADHEHDGFGAYPIQFAVGDSPEDVLGAIAADAEVGWLPSGEVFVPYFFLRVPSGGDGVPEEEKLGLGFSCDFEELFVGDEERVGFDRRDVRPLG